MQAAEVYEGVLNQFNTPPVQLTERTTHLIAIHKAPEETWPTLVQAAEVYDKLLIRIDDFSVQAEVYERVKGIN
ncbi:MAG: hypothetical protein HC884_00935 [Chloroflexaceae bacterium]|nr:hypothetical protein [Chloroflexaceae bacterium]